MRSDCSDKNCHSFISIVIPAYNAQRTIKDCLDSLLNQDYSTTCYEIILVDNNSNDDTVKIAKQYERVKVVNFRDSQSSYGARNLGISVSNGVIIAFTDADCIADHSWIHNLVTEFKDENAMVAVGSVLDDTPSNIVEKFLADINLFIREYDQNDQYLKPVLTNNTAYRRTILEELHGFNDHLYTGGDIDLGWRTQMLYPNTVRIAPKAIVYHRHRSSLKSMFRQFRRHGFGEIFLDAIYRKQPGYPRTLRFQIKRMSRQVIALIIYVCSFVYRLLKYPFRRDIYYLVRPLLWFVAESGNIWGKLQGLWATKFLLYNPVDKQWNDPGG